MRGFQDENTASNMMAAFRNYYNFIKPHSALGGATPAQRAGIGVPSNGNKWLTLLQRSMKKEQNIF
jgi:hypothetical protein